MKMYIITFVLFLLLLAPNTAYAQDEQKSNEALKVPISLNSVVLFALHENPDIQIGKKRQIQAREAIREKVATLYPDVSLRLEGGRGYNNPAGGGTPGSSGVNNTGQIALTLEQLVFDGFKTIEEIRQREDQARAAKWQTTSQLEDVLDGTVENYLKALRYQNAIKSITSLKKDMDKTVRIIREMFEAGAAGKVMLDYAKSRQAFANTELNRAQSSLNDAISNLEFLTGKLPPGFVAKPPESLSPDKLDLQYYLDTIQKQNSEVKASQHNIEAQVHKYKAEKGRYYPTVSFNVTADTAHNDGGEIGREDELSATFRLSYKIFEGFKRDASLDKNRAIVEELDIRKRKLLKELRRKIKLAYNQIKASESSLSTTKTEIASSEALKELNEENFRLGNINVIELIESAERLNSARLKKHELNFQRYYNSYKLLILTGVLKNQFFCETCEIAMDEM